MLYPNLKFPKPPKHRPFFYTNFVQTVDGKVAVDNPDYWPIGSKEDLEVFNELRTHADCIIQGGGLAEKFGEITLKSISRRLFQQVRRVQGKSSKLPYYVITKHPQKFKNLEAEIFSEDLSALIDELKEKDYQHVLIEGGPTLLGSFVADSLLDEVFLTIAPKIMGSKPNSTKTLIEGVLLPPNKFKLKLISVKKIKDELFLRYRLT